MNESAHVYKDFGAAHFDDFEHLIEIAGAEGTSGAWWVGETWMLSQGIGDRYNLTITNDIITLWVTIYHASTTGGRIEFTEHYNESNYNDVYTFASYPVHYWLTIEKSGTGGTCKIYSDVTRTTLVDTLSLTLQADHYYRYCYGCNTYNSGDTRYGVIDIDNLDLQESIGIIGHYPMTTAQNIPMKGVLVALLSLILKRKWEEHA